MTILRWIGDEALLHHWVDGFSTLVLLIIIAVCILLLSKGADWMIDGAVDLAQRTGMSKVAIGATIISLGTTTPEAFVSVMAAFMGNSGLALGNGVGSIIADTGMIFGLTCIMARVPLDRYILNRTGWVQVGAATLLVAISVVLLILSDSPPVLGRGVGLVFILLLAGYLYLTYLWARAWSRRNYRQGGSPVELMGLGKCWVLVTVGLIAVIAGARLLVPSASEIAERLGVPDDVIAATLVAFGTSLPELMTAIMAVKKKHPEIAVGNVVGADVLNCLFVIGAAACAKPLAIPPNFYYFHFPAMLIVLWSFRAFVSVNRQGFFKASQGVWLLAVYAVYVFLQYALNFGGPGA